MQEKYVFEQYWRHNFQTGLVHTDAFIHIGCFSLLAKVYIFAIVFFRLHIFFPYTAALQDFLGSILFIAASCYAKKAPT